MDAELFNTALVLTSQVPTNQAEGLAVIEYMKQLHCERAEKTQQSKPKANEDHTVLSFRREEVGGASGNTPSR